MSRPDPTRPQTVVPRRTDGTPFVSGHLCVSISHLFRASIGACALGFLGLTTACPALANPDAPTPICAPPAAAPPAAAPPATPEPATPEQQQWPDALRSRNSRRAVLTRVDDLPGDAHERVVAEAFVGRIDDPIGDREEDRRDRGARARPPRASRFAEIARTDDRDDDARQIALQQLPVGRRHAEIRRYRDLSGDQEVLALYMADQHDGVRVVNESPGSLHEERDDSSRNLARSETDNSSERRTERVDDSRRDRELNRSEAAIDRERERLERQVDHSDALAEEAAATKTELATERKEEKADERKVERKDERAADRRDERQLQREEQKPGTAAAATTN
jgi:hypothetical protein